ncbi:hypothetical protein M9458_037429, partial [Cirrhinus mrigala]
GLRNVFPDFYENIKIPSVKNVTENRATCKRPEVEKKFTSPFSIESLLQRESSAPVRQRPALCATRNFENASVGLTNGDRGLGCKRKTWDWPHQTSYASFSRPYSHISFPTYSLGHMNDGCSPSSEPFKRMRSFSELSYCTAPESIRHCRQFTPNAVAYM